MPERSKRPVSPFAGLPVALQHRIQSIGAYVDAVLEDTQERTPAIPPLNRSETTTIKLAVTAGYLVDLFESTTQIGGQAVETFQRLGVESFVIGSSEFFSGSTDLLRGEKLALRLRELLPRGLLEGRETGQGIPLSDMITRARQGLLNARRLG